MTPDLQSTATVEADLTSYVPAVVVLLKLAYEMVSQWNY